MLFITSVVLPANSNQVSTLPLHTALVDRKGQQTNNYIDHRGIFDQWVLAAVQARQVSDRVQAKPRAELTAYLQSPLEQTEDVVRWWGVSFYFCCESFCI